MAKAKPRQRTMDTLADEFKAMSHRVQQHAMQMVAAKKAPAGAYSGIMFLLTASAAYERLLHAERDTEVADAIDDIAKWPEFTKDGPLWQMVERAQDLV
jgi:hypothetical protein